MENVSLCPKDLDFNKIICHLCEDISKIKINYNWEIKQMDVKLECSHDINDEIISSIKGYCTNCKKLLKLNDSCSHNDAFIEKDTYYFYCKEHYKKYEGYVKNVTTVKFK